MAKKKAVGPGGAREGAGRKPGPDGRTMMVAVTVPKTLVAELDAYADAQGWKRSKAVTEAIRALLARKRK
jgi:hypothetical protein